MNVACEVITDLLPLYHDGVCNEASKKLIDAHLTECEKCKAMLKEMNDNQLDEHVIKERESVVENHMKSVKKKFFVQGASIAMAISIIPTFAINLATSGTLDWFFIVLAGTLLFGSLTLVPGLVEKNRGLWTLASSTVSLLLLLYVIESYVSGPYAVRWFGIAAVSVLATMGASAIVAGVLGRMKR